MKLHTCIRKPNFPNKASRVPSTAVGTTGCWFILLCPLPLPQPPHPHLLPLPRPHALAVSIFKTSKNCRPLTLYANNAVLAQVQMKGLKDSVS